MALTKLGEEEEEEKEEKEGRGVADRPVRESRAGRFHILFRPLCVPLTLAIPLLLQTATAKQNLEKNYK